MSDFKNAHHIQAFLQPYKKIILEKQIITCGPRDYLYLVHQTVYKENVQMKKSIAESKTEPEYLLQKAFKSA